MHVSHEINAERSLSCMSACQRQHGDGEVHEMRDVCHLAESFAQSYVVQRWMGEFYVALNTVMGISLFMDGYICDVSYFLVLVS